MSWLRLRATSNCSPIHIRHIQSVWAHWYAVHWHITAAILQRYTHPTWLRFWGSESLVESKWCLWDWGPDLKQISPSILDIYKVFAHIYMLSIGIQQPSYRVIPILFGSDFGVLGHLWSQNDVNTSWLRLTATSNCFPHPYYAHTKCLSTFICCALTTSSSLTQLYPSYVTWHTVAASNTF